VFISINQPLVVLPGDYTIVVNCLPAGMPSDTVSVDLIIRNPGVTMLGIISNRAEQPDAYSGDELGQNFTVTNTGNLPAQVAVSLESSPDWPVTIDPENRRLDLEPNESANVIVSTYIPEELVQSEHYRLTVTVRSEEDQVEEELEWSTTTRTRVIPRQLSVGSNYATLDGNFDAQVDWREDGELSTRISVDMLQCEFAEGRRVELGPFGMNLSGNGNSGLGQDQAIRAKYEDSEVGYIQAGDFSLDLMSPLLGQYTSGRGGDVLLRDGNSDYRAFYLRSRGSIPVDNLGFQFARQLGTDSTVRLTALRDSEHNIPSGLDRDAETSTNLGLYIGYVPSDHLEVAGEAGWTDLSAGGSDTAWRITGMYKQDGFTSNCEWLRAGGGFRGGWRNTELARFYLSWSPFEDLNLRGSFHNRTRFSVPDSPDEQEQTNRTQSYEASWNAGDIGRFSVSHRIEHSLYTIIDESDMEIITTEYSYSRDWDDFRFSASWQHRTEEERITSNSEMERLIRLDLSARLNRNASLRLGYTTGRTSENHGSYTLDNSSIRFGGDFTINRNFDASFNIERNMEDLGGNRTSASGRLAWVMPDGSSLNLDLRSYTGDGSNLTEIALGFTYPVSIPLPWFPRKGNMEGRVFHADDPEHGMANVRVSVGSIEMVTDDNGRFSFPALDPGEHQLTVNNSSLGVGIIPDVELPLIFIVDAGSTVQVDIPVRQSVVIGGQVMINVPGTMESASSQQPLPEMIIEIQHNGESSYRITDAYGRFLFTDLLPGSYMIILRPERLPQWHMILDPESYSLELESGDSRRDLVFVVAPIERNIEITTESPDN